MVLTDAELLELQAEIDRLHEALAKYEKQEKDWENDETEHSEELLVEMLSIKVAKSIIEEHLTELKKIKCKAIAEVAMHHPLLKKETN